MKAAIRDREVLMKLNPENFVAYVEAKGWVKIESRVHGASLFVQQSGSTEYELMIPTDPSFLDYATRVSQALNHLESVEDRSQMDIYRDVTLVPFDVIRIRAPELDSARSSIRLRTGIALIEHVFEMMAAAATTAISPRKVVASRRPAEVEEYLKRIEMGQSEKGSYVLTVLSSIQPLNIPQSLPLLESMESPFPRQVTRTLAKSLNATRNAVTHVTQGNNISFFDDQVREGVSANLCEALHGMLLTQLGTHEVALAIDWALKLPELSAAPSRFVFEEAESAILSDAAQHLRSEEPEEGVRVTGLVTNLHREADQEDGIATVACVVDNRVIQLKVSLPAGDYETAITAHREKRQIFFKATITKRRHQYNAEHVGDFKIGD